MRMMRRDLEETTTSELHDAFRTSWDQLEIHAHDIHSTTDGTIFATEALMRWRRSPGEVWAAAMALPIAEETGTIHECTTRATELSLHAWATSGRRSRGGRLSLNLYPTQLEHASLVTDIELIMLGLQIHPSELIFEIPDRIGPDGCRAAVDTLGPLLDSGSQVALDDHRGPASKNRTLTDWLPTGSFVKLDSALTSVCDDPVGRDLLELSADDLHADGYQVVAETIERPAQLAAVISCNIAWAQGQLFARPEPLV